MLPSIRGCFQTPGRQEGKFYDTNFCCTNVSHLTFLVTPDQAEFGAQAAAASTTQYWHEKLEWLHGAVCRRDKTCLSKGEGKKMKFSLPFNKEHATSTRAELEVQLHTCLISAVVSFMYTLSNKNKSAWNFLSPEPEVTCGTVAIIIRVVLLSPYLRIRGVSLSSIHYNHSHRVYINRRQQYICLIWN